MLQKIVLLLIPALIFIACSSGSGISFIDNSSSLSQIQQTFSSADNAVTSIYSGFSAFSVTCANGSPTSSTPGDPTFPGEDAFCALTTNTKSPDTVQGSYFVVSKVLCAIENSVSFAYETTATDHNNITFSESDPCFGPGGFDANNNANTTDIIPLALRDFAMTTGDYDYFIGIQLGVSTYNGGTEPDVRFYLKDNNGITGARIYQEGGDSIFEFVLDSNTNNFYYENKDYGNNRHIRLSANGTFDLTTGQFSSVASANYIHTEGEETTTGRSVMMYFDGTTEDYDHHVNGTRDPDFTAIPAFTYNADFYQWGARAITDHSPDTDPILDLSTIDMTF